MLDWAVKHGRLMNIQFQRGLRQELLEPGVLRLQVLESLGLRNRHAAKLGSPLAKAHFREALPERQTAQAVLEELILKHQAKQSQLRMQPARANEKKAAEG